MHFPKHWCTASTKMQFKKVINCDMMDDYSADFMWKKRLKKWTVYHFCYQIVLNLCPVLEFILNCKQLHWCWFYWLKTYFTNIQFKYHNANSNAREFNIWCFEVGWGVATPILLIFYHCTPSLWFSHLFIFFISQQSKYFWW